MLSHTSGAFDPPRLSSNQPVATFPVAYNTTGISSAVKVGTIRASATKPVWIQYGVRVVTAFNATLTNVLTLGTSTTATELLAAGDVSELTVGNYPVPATPKILAFAGVDNDPLASPSITLTGAVGGDRVSAVIGITTPANVSANFESTITVVDKIQQTTLADYAAQNFLVVLQGAGNSNLKRLVADTDIYAKYTQSGTAATTGAAVFWIAAFEENVVAIA